MRTILCTLKLPAPSQLARRRKIHSNPPTGVKRTTTVKADYEPKRVIHTAAHARRHRIFVIILACAARADYYGRGLGENVSVVDTNALYLALLLVAVDEVFFLR